MFKYLVPAVFCLFVLLSACEPMAHESVEPLDEQNLDTTKPQASGNKDDDQPVETDSTIILALATVNKLRESGCDCGDESMPSTSKLGWDAKLYDAALAHAKDMHAHNYFSHTGKNGDNIYQRLTQSGYITNTTNILAYGENIAFGNFDLEIVVQKWLESPSHCVNMMRESYQEMAIAHSGNYWVQVFGARRN